MTLSLLRTEKDREKGRRGGNSFEAYRSTAVAQRLLGQKFSGVIVADAYAAYKGVHPKDWQSCLAHIKTKAKELGQELALLKGQAAKRQARALRRQLLA